SAISATSRSRPTTLSTPPIARCRTSNTVAPPSSASATASDPLLPQAPVDPVDGGFFLVVLPSEGEQLMWAKPLHPRIHRSTPRGRRAIGRKSRRGRRPGMRPQRHTHDREPPYVRCPDTSRPGSATASGGLLHGCNHRTPV